MRTMPPEEFLKLFIDSTSTFHIKGYDYVEQWQCLLSAHYVPCPQAPQDEVFFIPHVEWNLYGRIERGKSERVTLSKFTSIIGNMKSGITIYERDEFERALALEEL